MARGIDDVGRQCGPQSCPNKAYTAQIVMGTLDQFLQHVNAPRVLQFLLTHCTHCTKEDDHTLSVHLCTSSKDALNVSTALSLSPSNQAGTRTRSR